MAIPNLDLIRRPALELLAQRAVLTKVGDIFALLAPRFDLTEEERNEMLPSGTQRKWHNRVNWSCFDLFKAGLLDRPKKGLYQINSRGRDCLKHAPSLITRKYLSEISEEFGKFLASDQPSSGSHSGQGLLTQDEGKTPEETIAEAIETLEHALRAEVLDSLGKVDPFRFEQVVIDLLFAMGYGGSRGEAARVTQKSNDEGIDGVINEDRLGLDTIYVQAKRWKNPVGRPEIQSFVGALAGKQAHKGVFITTSSFSQGAMDYASAVPQKVVLIDGSRVASLMIEYGIGVSVVRSLDLKRLDSDYFEEG
jgi:restriction system protein